jgi:hypothetical protein
VCVSVSLSLSLSLSLSRSRSRTYQVCPSDHSQDLIVLVDHAEVPETESAKHAIRALYSTVQ